MTTKPEKRNSLGDRVNYSQLNLYISHMLIHISHLDSCLLHYTRSCELQVHVAHMAERWPNEFGDKPHERSTNQLDRQFILCDARPQIARFCCFFLVNVFFIIERAPHICFQCHQPTIVVGTTRPFLFERAANRVASNKEFRSDFVFRVISVVVALFWAGFKSHFVGVFNWVLIQKWVVFVSKECESIAV